MPDGNRATPTIEGVAEAMPEARAAQVTASSSDGMARLRLALQQLEAAGQMAGVRPDDPVSKWMGCMSAVLECSSEIALGGEARIQAALLQIGTASETERRAARSAADRCRAEVERLEKYYQGVESRAENLVSQTITSMAHKIADEVKTRTVIVERRYNRRKLWERAAGVAAVMLVIFGAGLAAMRYEDSAAVALLAACETHPVTDASGAIYCPMRVSAQSK